MTVTAEAELESVTGSRRRWGPWQTALAIFRRDLFVTGREFPIFLAQVILQPLFLLFVFGKVLTELGYAASRLRSRSSSRGSWRSPRCSPASSRTALPLVIEFSYSNEIEDRLLAPLPIGAVAVEKVVFAAMRGCVAAAVMFPIGVWILGSIPWQASAVVRCGRDDDPRGAARLGDGTHPRHLRAAQPDQRDLRAGADPAHLHRLLAVPVALAELDPLVPGGLRVQPDDLRERGSPRSDGSVGAPHSGRWICFAACIGFLVVLTAIGMVGFIRRALG